MREYQSLSHVRWECKYHIVFVPKYRKKVLYGRTRQRIGRIFHQLCRQKEVGLIEGHAMPDHVHMVLSIPPKHSVSSVLGYLKGKSAIMIHREMERVKHGFTGKHFWAKGYFASTVDGLVKTQTAPFADRLRGWGVPAGKSRNWFKIQEHRF